MIGYLRGEVFEIFDTSIILLVNNVGYKVFPTLQSFEKIQKGDQASFYITSIIKEDEFSLYGFESMEEKNLFDLIINISGIGPRTANAILSRFKIDDIMNAVINSDDAFFTGVPRLGKKNAQKLIIELKGKIGSLSSLSFAQNNERQELIMALKGFGYQDSEIQGVIMTVEKNGGTLEQRIAFALKHLGRK